MADPYAAVAAKVMTNHNLVAGAAGRLHVAPAMLLAVIHHSSAGDPDAFRVVAEDHDALFGLTALSLVTARRMGYYGPPRMLFDAAANIELTAQVYAVLLSRYKEPFLALLAGYGGRRAVWWYKLGWQWGKGARDAHAVTGYTFYYERRLAALAT